jgi:hypothetical protein
MLILGAFVPEIKKKRAHILAACNNSDPVNEFDIGMF